jgi:hypothetical protein
MKKRQVWSGPSSGIWWLCLVLLRSDVSEEHTASIFKVRDFESHWFAARMYLTADGEESRLERHLHCRFRYNGVLKKNYTASSCPRREMSSLLPPWRHQILKTISSLLVTANFPSFLIIFTLMMEATRSSETSSLTNRPRCHIQEDGILRRTT